MIQPDYLKKGDTIAIVAPAGIIKNKASIYEAKSLAESWGLYVKIGKHVFDDANHFSATDVNRLSDLQEAFDDSTVKMIWCARGGYGTIRIVDDLNFSKFRKKPKWVVGYSDITVLHSHLHNLGFETIHGMMPVNMEFEPVHRKNSIATLQKALFGENLQYDIAHNPNNREGKSQGVLVGGNLTLLENLLGSNSAIATTDKIIFIEEIGEYKYHIDRLLRGLKRSGFFKNCNALLIGGMSHIKKNSPSFGSNIESIILNVVGDYHFPVAFDIPSGHDPENKALILGRNVTVDINSKKTTITFQKQPPK